MLLLLVSAFGCLSMDSGVYSISVGFCHGLHGYFNSGGVHIWHNSALIK